MVEVQKLWYEHYYDIMSKTQRQYHFLYGIWLNSETMLLYGSKYNVKHKLDIL